jgi:acetylornithine/succinyldiaminopimelate/putrescine aminotransferase
MCANPKALDIGYETLLRLTPEVSGNIVVQGYNFKHMLLELQDKFPNIITDVTGTGLLLAAHIREDILVVGNNELETKCRLKGLNVIHGGKNALRFTPWFLISDEEIDLIKNILINVLSEY